MKSQIEIEILASMARDNLQLALDFLRIGNLAAAATHVRIAQENLVAIGPEQHEPTAPKLTIEV